MEDAVDSLFTARCTADVGAGAKPFFYEQHETKSSPGRNCSFNLRLPQLLHIESVKTLGLFQRFIA